MYLIELFIQGHVPTGHPVLILMYTDHQGDHEQFTENQQKETESTQPRTEMFTALISHAN
jgi:hypothetical protein